MFFDKNNISQKKNKHQLGKILTRKNFLFGYNFSLLVFIFYWEIFRNSVSIII